VDFLRLLRELRFVVLAGCVGCGLGLAGELDPEASLDASSTVPVRDGGPGATLPDTSGADTTAPNGGGGDDAQSADEPAPGDDAGSGDDTDDAATSGPDGAVPLPPLDAGVSGDSATTDPCTTLKACCAQIKLVSSSGGAGCDSAVKADDPSTCQTLLTDFESTSLCH
jgi:hypothetical protein